MSTYELEGEDYLGSGEFEEEFGAQESEFGAHAGEFGAASHEAYHPEMQPYLAELQELSGEYESPLHEVQEMELATRLLEISGEEELEQFLGNLFKTVARGVGGFLRSGVGRALGGVLKNVAKVALPIVGGAIGSFVAPGVGTALGSKLGSLATRLFEVELEAMEQEDREFEVARRYVRLAAASARNAALAPRSADAQAVARASVLAASRRYARGLARRFPAFASPAPWYWPQPFPAYDQEPATYAPTGGEPSFEPAMGQPPGWEGWPAAAPGGGGANGRRPQSGRWIRRGRRLVVLGI
jgi:uncharacterized protein (DUF697 family)